MSIEKVKTDYRFGEDTFEILCDDCGESEEIEGSFEDCREWIKDNEWSSVLDGNEWYNYCGECKSKPKNR